MADLNVHVLRIFLDELDEKIQTAKRNLETLTKDREDVARLLCRYGEQTESSIVDVISTFKGEFEEKNLRQAILTVLGRNRQLALHVKEIRNEIVHGGYKFNSKHLVPAIFAMLTRLKHDSLVIKTDKATYRLGEGVEIET